MERHRRVYAWGQSMLAHLYHDLEEYVFGQGCSLMTCTLLQVWILEHFTCTRPVGFPLSTMSERPRVFAYPLTSEWRFGYLLYWRVIFDRLTSEVIVWRPYLLMHRWDGMERQLACLQRNRLLRGRYAHIIVPFYFDRVWRQFGLEQCVPADVPIYTRHSQVLPRPGAVARPMVDDIETTELEGSDQDVVTEYSAEPRAQRRYVSWFMRSYPGPIFPPDHPTGYPGPWRHGDRDEDKGSRLEELEEVEGHEEAGDPNPPTGDYPNDEEEEDEDADREEDEEDAGDEADEDEDEDDEEESDAAPHHSGDDTIALDPPLIPQQEEQEAIWRPVTSTVQPTPIVDREWRSLIQQAMTDISMISQIPSSSQIAYRPQGNVGWHEDLFFPFQVQVDIWRERERVLSEDLQLAWQRERVLSEDL
ncbi:hypothetical protein SUGI_0279950 [Cryptomeria japonica]|nr:hypothetical protein SUGI_0279950 [Cryptomeria japonica]